MTPEDRLRAARQAALEGRHAEALAGFLWFHEHALEERPSLRAVRLSYALAIWHGLGNAYPPARQALEAARARTAQALLDGADDPHLFHEVRAIDETLGQPAATRDLYAALAQRQPDMARRVVGLALPAIVQAGDYDLAGRVRPEPLAEIRERAFRLRWELGWIRRHRYQPVPMRWAFIRGYAELVRLHLSITAAVAGRAAAQRLEAQAVAAIADPLLRATIRGQIAKPTSERVWRRRRRGWSAPRRAVP
jgi:hypothetical protein